MTSLTLYGGVNEIGGNKILLADQDTRLFLDFGMSFNLANRFFDEYMKPRNCNGVHDLLELGLLPNLEGLYRCDYLEHRRCSFKPEPDFDGVLLSHAHMDHGAYIHYLREDIPLYCTQASKDILQSIEETGASGKNEYVARKEAFAIRPSGGDFVRPRDREKYPRTYHVVKDSFEVGELGAELYNVCHSLEGAASFILHSEAGSIVYTGDLRFRGYKGYLSREFVQRAAEADPVVLICEGTRIASSPSKDEQTVLEEAVSEVEKTDNLVIVNFPIRDTDRLSSFLQVARQTGRELVVNLKQAYLLELFEKSGVPAPTIDDDNIQIYIPRKSYGVFRDARFTEKIQKEDYKTWQREFLERSNIVSAQDIRENQQDYIFRCDYYELTELIDIQPGAGSCYIRSTCEPFDEQSELDKKRVEQWLRHFNLCPYKQIHASGHMERNEIKKTIETINPKILIPVHTENATEFEKLHDNVIIPETGREISL
jgi:ribonuclease J